MKLHQIFSLSRDWSKHVTWLNMPELKLGNIGVIFPNFQNCACCEKYLKCNKHNSLDLLRKYALIFVLMLCSSKFKLFFLSPSLASSSSFLKLPSNSIRSVLNCFVSLFCSDFSQGNVAATVILDKLLTKGKKF